MIYTMPIICASANLTMYCRSMKGSLMAVTLIPFCRQALRTRRPMRPNLHKQRAEVIKIFHNHTILYLIFSQILLSVRRKYDGTFNWMTVQFIRRNKGISTWLYLNVNGKRNNSCLSVEIWLGRHIGIACMTIRVCASVDGDFKLILGNPVLVIILNQAICSVSVSLSFSLCIFTISIYGIISSVAKPSELPCCL